MNYEQLRAVAMRSQAVTYRLNAIAASFNDFVSAEQRRQERRPLSPARGRLRKNGR
jgi:hypothetical protein